MYSLFIYILIYFYFKLYFINILINRKFKKFNILKKTSYQIVGKLYQSVCLLHSVHSELTGKL